MPLSHSQVEGGNVYTHRNWPQPVVVESFAQEPEMYRNWLGRLPEGMIFVFNAYWRFNLRTTEAMRAVQEVGRMALVAAETPQENPRAKGMRCAVFKHTWDLILGADYGPGLPEVDIEDVCFTLTIPEAEPLPDMPLAVRQVVGIVNDRLNASLSRLSLPLPENIEPIPSP